ncbi:MAG TPA: hypothetical protein VGL60_12655 [Acidimicrobiales bacterium]|jgi:hypothetical protein
MARRRDVFEFRADEPSPILARMDLLGRARDGWINLVPSIEPGGPEDSEPPAGPGQGPRITLAAVLGSPTPPAIPLCTWMPSPPGRGRGSAGGAGGSSIGILHARGRPVMPLLRAEGLDPPGSWRVRQDHQRRGLVVLVPAAAEPSEILAWTCRAGGLLCDVRPTGWWVATVFAPHPDR